MTSPFPIDCRSSRHWLPAMIAAALHCAAAGCQPENQAGLGSNRMPDLGTSAAGRGGSANATSIAYSAALDQVAPDQAAPDQAAPDQAAPDQAAPDQAAPDQAAHSHSLSLRPAAVAPVDPALRFSFIRARQGEASAEHAIVKTGALNEARNPAHRFNVRFGRDAVTLYGAPGAQTAWETQLSLAGIGRAGSYRLPAVEQVHTSGARVDYQRDGMREWYANGPLGLEQGFTLARPEPGSGEVELAIAVGNGLRPVAVADSVRVELRDANDSAVMQVSDLFVTDAGGKQLPASFVVRDSRIVLRFDDSNASYPVQVDPLVATLQGSALFPSDYQGLTFFGFSVGIHNGTAVIGAPAHDSGRGAAYVFIRSTSNGVSTWTQQQKLVPSTLPDASTNFGFSVAISGDTIAVGAPTNTTSNEGRAFVFARSGVTWTQQAALLGADGVADGQDDFGWSVALEGNTLCVGAIDGDYGTHHDIGRVTCFVRTANGWPSTGQALEYAGLPVDHGHSLALMGNTLLVGDPNGTSTDIRFVADAGRVYVFTRTSSTAEFQPEGSFPSPLPVTNGSFGNSIALASVSSNTNGTALIGELGSTTANGTRTGSAYVFVRAGSATWTNTKQLIPSTAVANSEYGVVALAVNGVTLRLAAAVAAPLHSGAIALFSLGTDGLWTEQKAIPGAAPGSTETTFGFSIDMDASSLAVGYPTAPVVGNLAAIYAVAFDNGDVCQAGGQCASGFCVDGRCCNSACGGGAVDCQACSTSAGGTQNGTCGALNAATAAATTCRASAGACDLAETCLTTQTTCPADRRQPSGFICRAANGVCDVAETCNGTSTSCPSDAVQPSSFVCRAAPSGVTCDVSELCNGSAKTCPTNGFKAPNTVCRPITIPICDLVAEVCSGSSASCPADSSFCP